MADSTPLPALRPLAPSITVDGIGHVKPDNFEQAESTFAKVAMSLLIARQVTPKRSLALQNAVSPT